jgi:hypothetical protein
MTQSGNNPFVAQSPRTVSAAEARAAVIISQRAREIYWDLVRAWAHNDAGPFPDRDQAERLAREELEVLCRGLGRWAAVLPHDVFPPVPPPPLFAEEGW